MSTEAKSQTSYPDVLQDVAEVLGTALLKRGLSQVEAEAIGWEVAEHLRLNFGGGIVYIPKGTGYSLGRRNAEIRRRLAAGESRGALAREFNLSLMQIGRIEKNETPIRC